MVTMSNPCGKVVGAFVRVSAGLTNPQFDSTNPFHKNKYVSLSGVREHVHTKLAAEGLAIVQSCRAETGLLVCTTTILHTSGEWISSDMPVAPNKSDAQGWAAASTYARRYGLLSILGIVGDDDDDGNYGVRPPAGGILAGGKIPIRPTMQPSKKPAAVAPAKPAPNLDDWADMTEEGTEATGDGAGQADPQHPLREQISAPPPVAERITPSEHRRLMATINKYAKEIGRDADDLKAEIKAKVFNGKSSMDIDSKEMTAAEVYMVRLKGGAK